MTRASELITIVDDFLPAGDCDALLAEAAGGQWAGSMIALHDGTVVAGAGNGRRSRSQFLDSPRLRAIEQRLSGLFDVSARHLEPWQMTRYQRGDFFDYHLDCGTFADQPSGERRRTIMIILEQPKRGGATHFRALGKTVRPQRGRLLVWNNLLPTGSCNYAMIHSGRPVWQGRKTILTTWERERPYE